MYLLGSTGHIHPETLHQCLRTHDTMVNACLGFLTCNREEKYLFKKKKSTVKKGQITPQELYFFFFLILEGNSVVL